MARYIGPKRKIERKFGEPIFTGKQIERKKYPPGQHGISSRRKKRSEYSIRLSEKQKAKYIYGILEKQFLKIFKEAYRRKGITGKLLLQLCESRLDNVVFRLKIGNTRRYARQLISHRHILVNENIVNIPSYTLKSGDLISIKKNSTIVSRIEKSLKSNAVDILGGWLTWNPDKMVGIFNFPPEREQIPENIKEQLIVELYSK